MDDVCTCTIVMCVCVCECDKNTKRGKAVKLIRKLYRNGRNSVFC